MLAARWSARAFAPAAASLPCWMRGVSVPEMAVSVSSSELLREWYEVFRRSAGRAGFLGIGLRVFESWVDFLLSSADDEVVLGLDVDVDVDVVLDDRSLEVWEVCGDEFGVFGEVIGVSWDDEGLCCRIVEEVCVP